MMNSKDLAVRAAFAVLTLSALLTGCSRQEGVLYAPTSEIEDHRATFTGGDTLQLPIPTAGTPAPAPDTVDLNSYVDEKGHRIPKSYYVVYCDIFYRLDWLRKQLRRGVVPPELGAKLQNVRKELTIATSGIAHDGNYRLADEALTLLESGRRHYLAEGDLAAAGAQISAAPWSVGRAAMQHYIDAGALGFGAKSLANTIPDAGADLNSDPSHRNGSLDLDAGGMSKMLTSRQRRAIAVALEYATDYHQSPHECATSDWTKSMTKISKLGDQLWLIKTPAGKDTGATAEIRPNSGTDTSVGELGSGSSPIQRHGTEFPGVPAPVGDPFLTPPPTMQPSTRGTNGGQTP